MTIEQQALDLVKENEALKSQVNTLLSFMSITAMPVFVLAVHDYSMSHGPASNLTDLEEVISKTPEQCLNNVKADAIEEAATACFDAGYRRPVSFLRIRAMEIRSGDDCSYKE